MTTIKAHVYQRITDRIVAELEQAVRPWLKPWSSEHAAGRITRPLRHNGVTSAAPLDRQGPHRRGAYLAS